MKMQRFMKKKYLWVVAILVLAYFLYTMYGMREGLAGRRNKKKKGKK